MVHRETFAYLGPPGTYTEIALRRFFSPKEAIPYPSVRNVFEAVIHAGADAGLVPLESFSQGPVAETFDLFREYHGQVHIDASVTLPIVHSLGVLGGNTYRLRRIFAHPQALQQCRNFLSEHFPLALLVESESNAVAVDRVKQQEPGTAGAIAAAETLAAHDLTVVASDIGDGKENATRFGVIRRGPPLLTELNDLSGEEITSVAINPRRDRQGLLFDLLRVISLTHRINISSIHSRPDRKGGFIFYLNLEGHAGNEPLRSCIRELEYYCRHETGATAEVFVFGSYRAPPFQPPAFRTIGIVGGRGVMGAWFERFFRRAGLVVHLHDLQDTPGLAETVQSSDVILLSVPMNALPRISEELAGLLRPGQLVAENCSIKSIAIPVLLEKLPASVEVLGMHTMFGDTVENLTGENIIFTRTDRSGRLSEAFEALFYKWGALITEATLETHDRTVALIQSLCHLILLVFVDTCREGVHSPDALMPFHTPNSRLLFEAAQRIVYQSDSLIADLQLRNPMAVCARNAFLETLFQLVLELNHGKTEDFLQLVHRARMFFESRRR